ncbi:MAG: hypothetical protein WBJ01_01180 [Tissierellaceae bacterium]|nr:hypothetical protein [Tissierellia bacterium]
MDKRDILLVGIIEKEPYTIDIIRILLNSFDYLLSYTNERGNIIILSKGTRDLIVISMAPREAKDFKEIGLDFNFLVVNIIGKDFKTEDLLECEFRDCDYYILNSDEDNISFLAPDNLEGIVITYGFNSKATMTISSFSMEQGIEASLCLQREIVSLNGERVMSSEFIIEIDFKKKDYIYSALAAFILAMILGEDIQSKKTLQITK